MNGRLRVLHLEDDPDYCDLVRSLLAGEGFEVDVVLTGDRAGFEAALAGCPFDVILADYSLPSYNGLEALRVARERCPDTPFLLVSGTIGEQAAIESLKAGATDYVLKQWPERLIPAVRRAVQGAEDRRQRRRVESELIRREKHFRALTENALDIVSILDRQGLFTYNSPSVKHVLEYEPKELVGQSAFAFIHAEDLPPVLQGFDYGLRNPGCPVRLEFRFRHRDGSWRCLEAVGQSRLEDSEIAGIVINSRDITERKRIEQRDAAFSKLGQSLSSATSPVEAARIIHAVAQELFHSDVFTLDLYAAEEDKIHEILNMDTNRAGERFELPRASHGLEPSRMARRIVEQGAELILREEPVVMPPDVIPIGDTSRPSASLMLVPIRNCTKVIGILSIQSYMARAYVPADLKTLQTLADHCGGALERIRAEQALRESEQRFRDLFEGSPDAVFVEDLDGVVLDINPAACRLHGTEREALIGKRVTELVPPERREEAARDFQALVEGRREQIEGSSYTHDGRAVPVEVRASRVSYSGQAALLLHVRDITDRKLAEAALRSSEMLFHSVWENSVDGMRLTDENGNIVAVNDAYCKLVGMTREELEGKPFTIIYAEAESRGQMLEVFRQRFRDRVVAHQRERRLKLHNGNVLTLEDSSAFVELRGQPPMLLGMFRDVTAQKRLEEQLRQSQKMEAIGQLAGGVAHDFNNILTVIQGHASLLAAGGGLTGLGARSAQQIGQAADRAAALTRQLLAFSRRQVLQPRRLDMNEVVANMTKMLGRILGEDIVLQLNYCPQPALVQADAGMMEQVLLNLAVNSRDAMPKGGALAIKISSFEVDARRLAEHSERHAGRFVCLSVNDSGCGIAPENLRRIFEPFFTTKEVGKGTGLGLATVYGIVKQHQGWIEVESTPGKGTTFKVFLPQCAEGSAMPEPQPANQVVRGGTETILVVEDEAPVRELVCNLLTRHGYRILQAESGVKALQLWQESKERIDLLLTDLVMPDRVNGRELAEQLWAEQPRLKVIFTSGYSADVVGKDFVLRPGLNYLQKPYHPHKLAAAVRECLDAVN